MDVKCALVKRKNAIKPIVYIPATDSVLALMVSVPGCSADTMTRVDTLHPHHSPMSPHYRHNDGLQPAVITAYSCVRLLAHCALTTGDRTKATRQLSPGCPGPRCSDVRPGPGCRDTEREGRPGPASEWRRQSPGPAPQGRPGLYHLHSLSGREQPLTSGPE